MSTNYYVRPHGTLGDAEGIHLGKSSNGSGFHFRAYPDADDRPAEVSWDVVDFDSWLRLLFLGDVETEAGTPISAFTMVETVVQGRSQRRFDYGLAPRQFRDVHGNRFSPYEFC